MACAVSRVHCSAACVGLLLWFYWWRGSGAVNFLIEEGVIAMALCRINTPLDTLVYLLPLLPLKGEEVSL